MARKRILLMGGSLNQTTQMYQIGEHLKFDFDICYTPYFCDGLLGWLRKKGFLDRSIAGYGQFYRDTMKFFQAKDLPVDHDGASECYDLVLIPTDLAVPYSIRDKKIVLVQEGMTDPENLSYHILKTLGLPHWLNINTAGTGQSDLYDVFCVASEGYRDLFIKKGVAPSKIRVTGIPNYDNAVAYCNNDFPHKGYALVATSDMREAFKYENRRKTIENAVAIANGRQLIFKLHPNEKRERAEREIAKWAPGALVLQKERDVHELIANCDILITQYSTVVYTGIALDKEVYSYFDLAELKRLTPIQNNGKSSQNIANVVRELIQ